MISYSLLLFIFLSILYGLIFYHGFWRGVHFALTLLISLFIVVDRLTKSTINVGVTATILAMTLIALLTEIWMAITNPKRQSHALRKISIGKNTSPFSPHIATAAALLVVFLLVYAFVENIKGLLLLAALVSFMAPDVVTVGAVGFVTAYVIYLETNVFLSVTAFLIFIPIVTGILPAIVGIASVFLLLGFLASLHPETTLEELEVTAFGVFYLVALVLAYRSINASPRGDEHAGEGISLQ